MKDIKAIIEGIVSQGKFVGSRGHAFRSSSSSDSSGGKHDHGVDIGAERNLSHQMATRQRVDQNTKNREQEMQKRNKEAEQRRKETTKMSKENIDEARRPGDLMGRKGIQDFLRTRDILSGKKPETKAPDSEKKPTQTVTKEETGTEARVKVKNVARPEDAAPNSEKSVLGKQGQIKTKIIDEEKLTMSMPNFGLSKSLIDSVRQIVEKKQDHDGDPKKMNGGKTEVDLDPETNDNMNDDDNSKKKSKSKKNDKDDDDDKKSVKEGKEHTVPKSEKEKKLAALASPKDKITHKDVLVGRGVVKEEEQKEESILSQEELDRLDEISKTTLSSYVKKVASTPADKVKKSREKGIETASKKLHKEEVELENLEEVSDKTLKSYIGKAKTDRENLRKTFTKQQKKGPQIFKGKSEYDSYVGNSGKSNSYFDKKIKNRKAGVRLATNKLTKEEVELEEMDNHSLSDYRREQRRNSPEEKAKREKREKEILKSIKPEMRRKFGLPEPEKTNEETDLEEGRGRPRKNPLPPGQETEGDDTHKHPMQQLEKISHSIEGREPHFEHKDDSKSKISRHLARHMVVVHNSMKTTQEKDDFANKLHANRESMRSAVSKHF